MHTEHCDQCEKKFTKTSKPSAIAAMRMHKGRVHGNIKNKHDNGSAVVHAIGGGGVALGKRRGTRRVSALAKKPRAKHGTSAKALEKAELMKRIDGQIEIAQAAEHFKFCPECGNNLEVLLRAYIVARRHRRREALDA